MPIDLVQLSGARGGVTGGGGQQGGSFDQKLALIKAQLDAEKSVRGEDRLFRREESEKNRNLEAMALLLQLQNSDKNNELTRAQIANQADQFTRASDADRLRFNQQHALSKKQADAANKHATAALEETKRQSKVADERFEEQQQRDELSQAMSERSALVMQDAQSRATSLERAMMFASESVKATGQSTVDSMENLQNQHHAPKVELVRRNISHIFDPTTGESVQNNITDHLSAVESSVAGYLASITNGLGNGGDGLTGTLTSVAAMNSGLTQLPGMFEMLGRLREQASETDAKAITSMMNDIDSMLSFKLSGGDQLMDSFVNSLGGPELVAQYKADLLGSVDEAAEAQSFALSRIAGARQGGPATLPPSSPLFSDSIPQPQSGDLGDVRQMLDLIRPRFDGSGAGAVPGVSTQPLGPRAKQFQTAQTEQRRVVQQEEAATKARGVQSNKNIRDAGQVAALQVTARNNAIIQQNKPGTKIEIIPPGGQGRISIDLQVFLRDREALKAAGYTGFD